MLKYVDGDFRPGTTAELVGNDLYLIEGKTRVHLNRDTVESVEKLTEETKHKWLAKAGWGIAGTFLLGPVGAAAGLFWGGKSKQFTIVCSLKDSRSFMAETDDVSYKRLVAMSLFASQPMIPSTAEQSTQTQSVRNDLVVPENCPQCSTKLLPALVSGRVVCRNCGWSNKPR
jgi:hypothetical protein